ncbi:nuclear transport factor 2 family protein [Variovorax sp. 22077]|uniref:nuclear transport factor 2 family protein n=1 Tax=Variovorax sp. 22077 TaxID=3453867 RepID=UPI003F85140A
MNTAEPTSGTFATSDLLLADEARYQALYARDTGALSQMLDDTYLHTHANGRTDDKTAFLASIAAEKYRFVDAQRKDQRVRRFGDVALLNGVVHTTVDVAGSRKTLHNAFFTAWRNDGHRWRMLHWQATKIVES